jgi:aldehyde dehydrogenase (NAD+)
MDTSFLKRLGIESVNPGTWSGQESSSSDTKIDSHTPVDGSLIGQLTVTEEKQYERVMEQAEAAFLEWRATPAPQRGEIVRQYGELLREYKEDLGRLVSYEMGKSLQEGWGEVQEMIDICDFALGQSRMMYGMTTHSERPQHRMYEQWHPLGVVGIISAFNFPVAVWAWNAMIALVCGNACVWKPSEKSSLCAIACQKLFNKVAKANNLPDGLCNVVVGDYKVGEMLTSDKRVPLISATGSTAMGKKVGVQVAERLGKTILELGGNNAMIITPSANMDLVLTAGVFGAVGTAGQRCTSTRRLIIHDSIYDTVKEKLAHAYGQLRIGNPLDAEIHVGPLIDKDAVAQYERALEAIKVQGGTMVVEGGRLNGPGYESGCYVKPCIAEVENDFNIVQHETFAPILYIMKYSEIEEAIHMRNDVPQGLSSAIVTDSLRESETFLSYKGSDCGIANVNIGTSGAEIGGAFGGEKETGGGRESGSDAWKAYMRRQTNTINWSREVPLAQGIEFDLGGE